MIKIKTSFLSVITILVSLFLLSGCIPSGYVGPDPLVDELSDIEEKNIILVSKVEIDPPISKDEEFIAKYNQEFFEKNNFSFNRFYAKPQKGAYISIDVKQPVDGYFTGKTKLFNFSQIPNKTFFIVGGYMYLKSGGIDLPARFKVNIQPEDKAIYIGSFYYKRDEFNTIIDIKLFDEYEQANIEFRNKFGSKIELKKRLVEPIE